MNWAKLLRILWGRRVYVLTPAVCTIIGGIIVIMTLPPRYEASTRVILDYVKPDPVTGFRVGDKMADAYISSQLQLVHSPEVTTRVVEVLGWLENPDMIAAWQAAPDKGDDFKSWAARQLGAAIGAEIIEDTNIMKIKFQAISRDMARLVADDVRTAYIEAAIAQARDTARANATNFSAQAERERERLVELQTAKADLERETGIMIDDRGISDADKMAVEAAKQYAAPPSKAEHGAVRSNVQTLQRQLNAIEASISAAGQTLGPNNPLMIEMHRRRDYVAARLAGLQPDDSVADQTRRRLAAITALASRSADRLTTVSDKQLALHLVQDEIARRQDLFQKMSSRAAKQMEISNVSDANLTPLGITTVAPAPKFPNLPLILGGCAVLGLACGAMLAFMVEAVGRRVRDAADLAAATSMPVLGEVPSIVWAGPSGTKVGRARIFERARPQPARERQPAHDKPKLSRS